MNATAQIALKKVKGNSVPKLCKSIEAALTEHNLVGLGCTIMSASVEDVEESVGDVSLQVHITDEAITNHFGADDAEDNDNEDGVRILLDSHFENVMNDFDDGEFEVEDIQMGDDDDEDEEEEEDEDDEDDASDDEGEEENKE